MVRQIDCVCIDTNSGFQNTVNVEANERLMLLQSKGCKIIDIKATIPEGRKVYILIEYDDPSIKVEDLKAVQDSQDDDE